MIELSGNIGERENMSGYRLWLKNGSTWEQENIWIDGSGCLMTLQNGSPCLLSSELYILQRSTNKQDISGQEIFEGDIIESHLGGQVLAGNIEVKYGTYTAYCPVDRQEMDSVGFYVSAPGLPDMPVGPMGDYAKVIGNICEHPELITASLCKEGSGWQK